MTKTKYCVGVVISKVYHINVEADSPEAAEELVGEMQTEDIYEQGSLSDVEVEHIEVV